MGYHYPYHRCHGHGSRRLVLFKLNSSFSFPLVLTVPLFADDKGLVLPPRVAAVQVVVVPCGITAKTTDEERKHINDHCEQISKTLKSANVRSKFDSRENYTPGYKFNHWEMRVRSLSLLSVAFI